MNHKRFFTRGIILLVAILISACTASAATPCPTSESQPCPTTEQQTLPALDKWRWGMSNTDTVVITFNPGDQCSMEMVNTITGHEMSYEIVVNDETYQNYIIVVETLMPDYSIKDLKAWPKYSVDTPPPYVHIINAIVVNPMSRTWSGSEIDTSEGPLYFTCFVEGPDEFKIIGNLGPVEVPTATP
jgi:hypothetical protein